MSFVRDIFASMEKGVRFALTAREISDLILIKYKADISPSEVGTEVRAMRIEGVPICSGSKGYWIAKNESMLRVWLAKRQGQIESQKRTLMEIINKHEINRSNRPRH